MLSPFFNMFGKRSRDEDNSLEATNSAAENVLTSTESEDCAREENNEATNSAAENALPSTEYEDCAREERNEATNRAAEIVLTSAESEDCAREENNDVMNEEPEISVVETGKGTSTMAQLLTETVPDADIHGPNVIIVGGQSSGKTKMIISMVFHHLIDNATVTDAMGEKLLRLFRTGEKMVTRRPTQINFVKIPRVSSCQISLNFAGESVNFDDPRFDQIVDYVHEESLVRDGRAYQEELRVTIAAPGLPNMFFTDLPGLVTDDREVSDSAEGLTIRRLVKRYMRHPQTTLVVVEPAATEDFDTSQVAPMIRWGRNRV
jgi:hypothetical protein